MLKRYLCLSSICLLFAFSACNPLDLVFPDDPPKPKDTLVLYVDVDSTAVRYKDSDTTFHVTAYWLDGQGQRLFKLSEESFRQNRWDGTKSRWSREGILLHQSQWDNGICIQVATDWFENGQVASEIHYDQKGNKTFEVHFHPNGNRRTDTIMYDEGKLHGSVRYYDSTGNRVLQMYSYVEDQLVGVKVFNDRYVNLANRVRNLEIAVERSRDTTTEEYRRRQVLLSRFAVKVDTNDVW